MVGDQETTRNWSDFVLKSEATWQCLQTHEHQILHRAAPAILKLHSAYFPGRWTRTAEDLLSEMSLRLACFYDDGSVHLWFSGTAIFNLLDIDVALDPDLRIEEVRFDG